MAKQSKENSFFAIVSPPAPHAPYTPAKRHENTFENIKALRTPNFNVVSDDLDKHWLLRMPPAPLPQEVLDNIDEYYRKRWQSLLAVDELVENVVEKLIELDLFENTYFLFTSDNGYHMGQFSMPFDKRQPYETDIRVPFIVTGPNINAKLLINKPIALIDLAPTIFDWANVTKPDWLDGQSFATFIELESNTIDENLEEFETSTIRVDDSVYERQLLIEYWGEGNADTYNPACQWRRKDRLNVIAFLLLILLRSTTIYIYALFPSII